MDADDWLRPVESTTMNNGANVYLHITFVRVSDFLRLTAAITVGKQ